jgi:hypothetical protein
MGQPFLIVSTTDCFRLDNFMIDESIHLHHLQEMYTRWNRVRCTDVGRVGVGPNLLLQSPEAQESLRNCRRAPADNPRDMKHLAILSKIPVLPA